MIMVRVYQDKNLIRIFIRKGDFGKMYLHLCFCSIFQYLFVLNYFQASVCNGAVLPQGVASFS